MSATHDPQRPTGTASGRVLGDRYEVIRELGRGGMGVVYACVDRATGTRVALKRVDRPGKAVAARDTFWFHQEALALASLDHPAIVHARDFGVLEDGSPYLVMDLVSGASLQTLLEQRARLAGASPLRDWAFVWSIVDQALAALAHAHARGVIHGDLKPQNLLVQLPARVAGLDSGGDPRLHVLDFGLAFLLRDRHDPRLDGATKAEVALPTGGGTPGFMAPEQIRRAVPHVGPPTDLYALGCLVFQLVTGRPPYVATRQGPRGVEQDEEALLKLHKSAPVPSPELPPGVPREVGPLVARMLAKRPWRRFDYAADLRVLWERVRPTGLTAVPADEGDEGVDERDVATRAPDTRVDVLTIAAVAPPALIPPHRGAPELLGLRPTPLVGRRHEREELTRLIDAVATSEGPAQRMAVLVGEAGVGKSRIAEWLCERAHEHGRMVPLRARYRRINGPLDGLNGAVLSHYGLERVDRILVEQALINSWEVDKDDDEGMTWVAATAEWLRPSSVSMSPDRTNRAAAIDPAAAQERRTRERAKLGPTGKRFTLDEPELRWLVIRRVLERIGRDRPILLWLDDIHWCPPGTFDGLAKIRRDAPHLRMFIVATARHEALHGDPTIASRLEAMRRTFGGPRMTLRPLDAADTQALLRAALPLDDRALQEAETRSKGNPLFALQLLHAWAATGGLEFSGGRYRVSDVALANRATTTGELWDERLLTLAPAHRSVAEAAAALGLDFRGDVLRRLAGTIVGLGGFGAEVARAIDVLERTNILVEGGEDRFRFPHALLQEHLLARLAERDDAREIFRAAEGALAIHPLSGTRRVVRHRVLNFLRAGDSDAAASLLLDYVGQAWMRVRDASRTLEDLALLDVRKIDVVARTARAAVAPESRVDGRPIDGAHDLLPAELSPRWSATHQRWRAEALRHAGRFEEAREAAQRARRVFLSLGEEPAEAHAMRLLGHIASEQGNAQEGRKLVARALTIFDRHSDDAGRASCEVVLGEIDYLLGDHATARDELHRGGRRFRQVGDALGRGQCMLLLGMIELAEGVLQRSRDLLLDARNEFDGIGYRLGLCQCDVALAHVEHRAGELSSARARATRTRDALRALENPRGIAGVERLLAMLAIDAADGSDEGAWGPNEAAIRHGEAALEVFEKLGDPWGIAEGRLLLAQEALVRGATADAEVLLAKCDEVSLTEAEPLQHLALTHAWLWASRGDFVAASKSIADARKVFADPRRLADHAPMLLQRFAGLGWSDPAGRAVSDWCDAIIGARGAAGSAPLDADDTQERT